MGCELCFKLFWIYCLVRDVEHAPRAAPQKQISLRVHMSKLADSEPIPVAAGVIAFACDVVFKQIRAFHPDGAHTLRIRVAYRNFHLRIGAPYGVCGRLCIAQCDKACLCCAIKNMQCRVWANGADMAAGLTAECAAATQDQADVGHARPCWQEAKLSGCGVEDGAAALA